MNLFEKKYLRKLQRAEARARRREFIVRVLFSGYFGTDTLARWALATSAKRRRKRSFVQTEPQQSTSDHRAVLAAFLLIAVAVVAAVAQICWESPHRERAWPLLVTVVFGGIIVGAQRAHGAWRARRNARLVLEWERRFDSEARR